MTRRDKYPALAAGEISILIDDNNLTIARNYDDSWLFGLGAERATAE